MKTRKDFGTVTERRRLRTPDNSIHLESWMRSSKRSKKKKKT